MKLFAGLPLEERIAAIGTLLFVFLASTLTIIQLQLNSAILSQHTTTYAEQISRQLAAHARFDTFNNEAISLNAILHETIESPLVSRARILGIDGQVLAEAKGELSFSDESEAFRSEIAYDKSVVGYSEIFLDVRPNKALQTSQLYSTIALLFAASLLCYLVLRFAASKVSLFFITLCNAVDDGNVGTDYPHQDALGDFLLKVFGKPAISTSTTTEEGISASTTLAVRIHDWSSIARQVDKLILEQIARQLQQCVEAVATQTLLTWEPAPGGFDIVFTAEEFDASTAADTLVIAELLLRMQAIVDQQRLREGKIPFAIAIGIGEVIPPSLNTQRRQPTLISQLMATARQQANFYASAAEANHFVVSDKFIEYWSLASVIAEAQDCPKARASKMAQAIKPPYSDIVDQHLQAILSH